MPFAVAICARCKLLFFVAAFARQGGIDSRAQEREKDIQPLGVEFWAANPLCGHIVARRFQGGRAVAAGRGAQQYG